MNLFVTKNKYLKITNCCYLKGMKVSIKIYWLKFIWFYEDRFKNKFLWETQKNVWKNLKNIYLYSVLLHCFSIYSSLRSIFGRFSSAEETSSRWVPNMESIVDDRKFPVRSFVCWTEGERPLSWNNKIFKLNKPRHFRFIAKKNLIEFDSTGLPTISPSPFCQRYLLFPKLRCLVSDVIWCTQVSLLVIGNTGERIFTFKILPRFFNSFHPIFSVKSDKKIPPHTNLLVMQVIGNNSPNYTQTYFAIGW